MNKVPARRFDFVRMLAYARYSIAGAIGGIAIYNTFLLFASSSAVHSGEGFAMSVGAIAAAALVKVLHVV